MWIRMGIQEQEQVQIQIQGQEQGIPSFLSDEKIQKEKRSP